MYEFDDSSTVGVPAKPIYGLGPLFNGDVTVFIFGGMRNIFNHAHLLLFLIFPFFYASNSNIEMLFIVDTISRCRLRTSGSSLHLGIIFNLALSCTIFNFL